MGARLRPCTSVKWCKSVQEILGLGEFANLATCWTPSCSCFMVLRCQADPITDLKASYAAFGLQRGRALLDAQYFVACGTCKHMCNGSMSVSDSIKLPDEDSEQYAVASLRLQ